MKFVIAQFGNRGFANVCQFLFHQGKGLHQFHEETVKMHAKHAIGQIVTPEMEERKERLLDVALHMMLSQGVDGRGGQEGTEWVKRQLAAAFHRGRLDGYCEACELLYVRR